MACTKERDYTAGIIACQYHNSDNTGRGPVATNADTIAANVYAITIDCKAILTGHTSGSDVQGETQYGFSNPLQRFEITTLNNYDTTHAAGTLITDNFSLLRDTIKYTLVPLSPSSGNYDLIPAFNFQAKHSDQDTFSARSWIILMHPPTTAGQYRFAIDLVLKDSTRFTDTLSVYLK